jgi:hypothetical protein
MIGIYAGNLVAVIVHIEVIAYEYPRINARGFAAV